VELAERLIDEEMRDELTVALRNFKAYASLDTLAPLLDAIVDSVYVLMQLSNTLHLPFGEAYAEVHRSNMSKRGKDGKVTFREDGKVLKPANYSPAQLQLLLAKILAQHAAESNR
jgi:predicted HAD superfamily Cof-like phosphohydrolase